MTGDEKRARVARWLAILFYASLFALVFWVAAHAQTPEPTQAPACAVLTHWSVEPGALAVIEARTWGSTGPFNPFMVIREQWPLPAVPLYGEYEYLMSVPGPTLTVVPTPHDTRTPEPTQTPWVVVVTATPEPTATARPLAPVLLPLAAKPRRRP